MPRSAVTPFKSPGEVREHFSRIINQKRGLWKAAFIGGSLLGLALLWPLIQAAVLAGFGIAVIGVLLVAAGVSKRYLPLLWQKVDNHVIELQQREAYRHLEALKAAARRNPIEQHESSLRLRRRQLQDVRQVLEQIKGRMDTWADRLTARKKQLKARGQQEDLSREEQAVEKMTQFYENRKTRYLDGIKACDAKEQLLESLRFKWDFAKEAGELAGQLDPAAEDAFLQKLLDDEAARAVETQFNATWAKIDLDITELNDRRQLSFDGNVIDISAVHIPTAKDLEYVSVRS